MLTKKNKDVKVVILTSDKSNILKLDVQKFNKEYPTLEVAKTDKFHDRFIAIDDKELYHVGASLKDLGNKCFAISSVKITIKVPKWNLKLKIIKNFQKHLIFCPKLGIIKKNIKERRRVGANPTL